MMADPENRLEALPYDLRYNVYSRFNMREAARLALVSRCWLELWRCGSHLYLNEDNYETIEDFIEHVHITIQRYEPQKFRLESCLLLTTQGSVAREVMRTLQVRDLILHCVDPHISIFLGQYILARTNFVTVTLKRCQLSTKINWINVENLRLHDVSFEFIGKDLVSGILGNCPVISELELCECEILSEEQPVINSMINIDQFRRLASLLLERLNWLTGVHFKDFSTKLPCLEVFTIRHCAVLSVQITIESISLKALNIDHDRCVMTAFRVPSLRNFNFESRVVPRILFIAGTDGLQSNISMNWRVFQIHWFRHLKYFLEQGLNHSNVCLSINLGRAIAPKKKKLLKALSTEEAVIFETLKIGVESSLSSIVLEALFCSFHPRNLFQIWRPSLLAMSIEFRELVCRLLYGHPPALPCLVKAVAVSDSDDCSGFKFMLQWSTVDFAAASNIAGEVIDSAVRRARSKQKSRRI